MAAHSAGNSFLSLLLTPPANRNLAAFLTHSPEFHVPLRPPDALLVLQRFSPFKSVSGAAFGAIWCFLSYFEGLMELGDAFCFAMFMAIPLHLGSQIS